MSPSKQFDIAEYRKKQSDSGCHLQELENANLKNK
jgi:hypothetical protein